MSVGLERELRDAELDWTDLGDHENAALAGNASATLRRYREALEACAQAPHSGWTIAQALARTALTGASPNE